jgi:hypothetical protein
MNATPETDVMAEKLHAEKSPLVVSYHAMRIMARRLERERDEWKARFADAVERLEGKLHCVDECKCSGRREVNMLRGILFENAELDRTP